MGMTIVEKTLAKASGKSSVTPGEIITATIDMCMCNDATAHINIDIYEKQLEKKRIFDPQSVVFVVDHNIPADSEKTAAVHKKMRTFVKEHHLKYHEGDGVCHQIMLENHVVPGAIIIGADSHTCSYGAMGALGIGVGSTDFVYAMATGTTWLLVPETIRFHLIGQFPKGVYARDLILKIIGDIGANGGNYKVMELGGEAVQHFTIDDRIVLCNMAIEAGAKSAVIEENDLVVPYVNRRDTNNIGGTYFKSDDDAQFSETYHYNLNDLKPMIAKPDHVDHVDLVKKSIDIPIHQAFLGSCNNGRVEELRVVAEILKGQQVHPDVRFIITPASKEVYLEALEEGLLTIFSASGAMVMNPNCSVCWGSCQGVIGENEVLISTGTRNFKGRSGHPSSKVYLASAATVATSAIQGKISVPRKYKSY